MLTIKLKFSMNSTERKSVLKNTNQVTQTQTNSNTNCSIRIQNKMSQI